MDNTPPKPEDNPNGPADPAADILAEANAAAAANTGAPPKPPPDGETPKPMTQAETVDSAAKALSKWLKYDIANDADRARVVMVARTYFQSALQEGLNGLPAGSFVPEDKAFDIIKAIYNADKNNIPPSQWDGNIDGKPVAQIVKEAAQQPLGVGKGAQPDAKPNAQAASNSPGDSEKTLADRLIGIIHGIIDNAPWAATATAAATAAATLLPNKETDTPGETKMGFFKTAVIAVGSILTLGLAAKSIAPQHFGQAADYVSGGKWTEYENKRRAAVPAAGATQGV